MISSGTRTVTTPHDFTCDVCGFDGAGVLVDDPELRVGTWHCPECAGEQDIEFDDGWRE